MTFDTWVSVEFAVFVVLPFVLVSRHIPAPTILELDECVNITQVSMPFVAHVAWAVKCYRLVESVHWSNASASPFAIAIPSTPWVRRQRFYFDSHPIVLGGTVDGVWLDDRAQQRIEITDLFIDMRHY